MSEEVWYMLTSLSKGSVSSSGARGAGSGVEAEHVDDLARTLDAVAPFPGSGDAEHASQP